MISICIPVYNFDVSALVVALESQIQYIEHPIQIVLIDDASKEQYRKINDAVCSKHHYIKLDQNIGRSAIRNLFIKHAQHEHLLFLDCDSLIAQPNFIATYVAAIQKDDQNVICGGRVYPTTAPSKEYLLRWKYGRCKESKSAAQRAIHANRSFMTNNFVVRKSVLEAIGFDERLRNYGHEDTLFGFELKENNIQVIHINNPVLNGHLETNQEYLTNTEKAIENLVHILHFTNHDDQIIQDVTLLRVHNKLRGLGFLINLGFALTNSTIKKRLLRGKVNLRAFDFYKLGYLHRVLRAK